jgi:hypothetical protein
MREMIQAILSLLINSKNVQRDRFERQTPFLLYQFLLCNAKFSGFHPACLVSGMA